MRLLSFLTEIERAVLMEANAAEGAVWSSSRMVNFQTGLGRLMLTLRPDAEPGMPEGSIVVQHFALADGAFCLKASLQWTNASSPVVLSVYETPQLNWKMEAARVAATWMAGAPAEASASGGNGLPDTVAGLAATGTE